MFFKKGMDKRGDINQQLLNVIKDLILVALVAIALFSYIHQTISNKSFEMSYLARDVAMLEHAVYASPYDVVVEYSSDLGGYIYDFEQSKVTVYEEKDSLDINKYSYHVAGDKGIYFQPNKIEEDAFLFKKELGELKVK